VRRLIEEYSDLNFYWAVLSSNPKRSAEARAAADRLLAGVSLKTIAIKEFRNGYFPSVWAEIKEYVESLKNDISPDVIFTHYRSDLHQDHRVLNELTWNTFRDHFVLEYEIPKYDGDLGAPNFFVPLPPSCWQEKVDTLMTCFKSEHGKQWFTADTFSSLMRLRGVECNSASGYAEAFYCRKACL